MSENSSENIIEYFVLSIYPLLLLVIGILGNFLGFIITSRKKFKKLSTRNLLRFLAVLDTFYLLQIVVDYLTNTFNLDIRLISSIWCKAFTYLNYSICPVSSWSLVIISIERVISITSSKYTLLFSNKNFKLTLIIIIILFNLICYSPYAIFIDLIPNILNGTNETVEYSCDYAEETPSRILPLLDLLNSSVFPFTILTAISIYTICFIFESRSKFATNEEAISSDKPTMINRKEKLKKDIQFSFTLMILNIIFLIFNLPICIANYTEVSEFFYIVTLYLFYTNFATNFWIFFIFNSLFRSELLVILKLRK